MSNDTMPRSGLTADQCEEVERVWRSFANLALQAIVTSFDHVKAVPDCDEVADTAAEYADAMMEQWDSRFHADTWLNEPPSAEEEPERTPPARRERERDDRHSRRR